uniref:Uncharacterized protein n=1 Tax=Borrelia hermsii TaxID=140 RepID=T1EC65_BORHE|nr:hypothetical protein BHA005 [Borrelia hermsii]
MSICLASIGHTSSNFILCLESFIIFFLKSALVVLFLKVLVAYLSFNVLTSIFAFIAI